MKKLGLVVAVLMVAAAPALATVNITCTADGNVVSVKYSVVGYPTTEPNKVRAFALDITVDSPAKINTIDYKDPNYWVYPGSIVIVNGEVNDVGSPDANSTDFPPPGTLPGLDSNGVTIEMGSLYYPTGDNETNAPGLSGTLLKFTVCHVFSGCKVEIKENTVRGGVVLTNPTIDPTVTIASPAYTFPSLDCLVGGAVNPTEKTEWIAWGKPGCWCYARQCRGDINGKLTAGKWVQAADLTAFRAAFGKTDAELAAIPNGICSDLNHKATAGKRVQAADLTIFRTYFGQAVVPLCNEAPIITGPYNFWITPP
jgi:hypothetical protein